MNEYISSYEYESNVNPILNPIPIISKNIENVNYGINSIDLSSVYNVDFKSTTPNLLANFIKIQKGETLFLFNNENIFQASSHFFYIMSSNAIFNINNISIEVKEGDIMIYPCLQSINILNKGNEDLNIYYINDSPLLNYLGSMPIKPLFKHAIYSKEYLSSQLNHLSNPLNNRKGILLSNSDTEKLGINTITPVLWSLYNELPPNTSQKPHKHNSVALDICIESLDWENIYTLVGEELDLNGNIINPTKIHWKKGEMFITPPGLWHSHHNFGNTYAYILPIQDAGLLLYQRILGIVLKN
jgi:gentisate 1,2-dioxygenase